MIKNESSAVVRIRKHKRIRRKLKGTALRPRVTVFFSNTHIRAQIIDDDKMHTLVSSSTLSLKLLGSNATNAVLVAKDLAKKAKSAKISSVVFDRSGYLYHGKVMAFANELREQGLVF